MSSITSLLTEAYAGIPKSEYLKRLQGAAQPQAVPEPVRPQATSNSAAIVDLSPEAQAYMQQGGASGQNYKEQYLELFQKEEQLLTELTELTGIEFDTVSSDAGSIQIITYEGEKMNLGNAFSRYFLQHTDQAQTMIEKFGEVRQEFRDLTDKVSLNDRVDIGRTSLSGLVVYAADRALQEAGLQPTPAGQEPQYEPDATPDELQIKADYIAYKEYDHDPTHGPDTSIDPAVQALIQPELTEYTDAFGLTKYRPVDRAYDYLETAFGALRGMEAAESHYQTMMAHQSSEEIGHDFLKGKRDEAVEKHRARLEGALQGVRFSYAERGQLEEVAAILNPRLEQHGLSFG